MGKLICEKAQRIAGALNIKDIKFSDGWLASFKEWHMLVDHKRHGKGGSVDVVNADAERERLRGLLDGKDPEFLFNCDKTGFLWWATENHGLSTTQIPGKKLDKSWITVLVIINATGTRKIQLLFIRNVKQPQCFKKKTGKQWGFWYFSNKTAWMTGEIFANTMETLDSEFWKDGIHPQCCLTTSVVINGERTRSAILNSSFWPLISPHMSSLLMLESFALWRLIITGWPCYAH